MQEDRFLNGPMKQLRAKHSEMRQAASRKQLPKQHVSTQIETITRNKEGWFYGKFERRIASDSLLMGAKSNVTVGANSGSNSLPIFVDHDLATEEVFDRLERTIESYYEGYESIDQYMRAGQENSHVVGIKMRNE